VNGRRKALTLRLSRVLQAPPAVVFRALTDADELARWWGPRGFTAPNVDVDLRVGGRYRIAMQPPDGDPFELIGEYLEVDPPVRLAYTFRYDQPDPDDQDTVVTLTLLDLDGSTELQLVHQPFTVEPRRALHETGWTESLDRLEDVLPATGPRRQLSGGDTVTR
jgi:uncharacterized protein YndB with AHSA1/START domain